MLQIGGVELHIADLLNYHSLDLVAVLFIFFRTLFNWLISTGQSLLHGALRLNRLLLALVTNLSGLFLAVFRVAVLLGFLGASLHLKLAYFLWLEVTVLFFHGEGKNIRKLLAVPVDVSLAYLNLDLSGNVVAILLGFPSADNLLLSITIILRGLLTPTVELHCVGAGYIVNDLLLRVAVRRLNITALVIILGGGIYLVGCVTDPILAREASLNLVSF